MADELMQIIKDGLAEIERRSAMSEEEVWAGELLKVLLGAEEWLARDHNDAPSGSHDLDLRFSDGRRIAVEVTTDTSPTRARFEKELEKINPLEVTGLKLGWAVDFDLPDDSFGTEVPEVKLKEVKVKLPPLLLKLEQEGFYRTVEEIDSEPPDDLSEHPIFVDFRGWHIKRAFPAEWVTPGTVSFGHAEKFFFHGPSDIAGVIANPLIGKDHVADNARKLLAALDDGAAEAHLFIWVPFGAPRNDAAAVEAGVDSMGFSEPPNDINLRGITSVWVGKFAQRAPHPELYGFTGPLWQFTDDGWTCWSREWNRHSLGGSH